MVIDSLIVIKKQVNCVTYLEKQNRRTFILSQIDLVILTCVESNGTLFQGTGN